MVLGIVLISVLAICICLWYYFAWKGIYKAFHDAAFYIWYFARDQYKLTREGIDNTTVRERDRIFHAYTFAWLFGMIFAASIVVVCYELL